MNDSFTSQSWLLGLFIMRSRLMAWEDSGRYILWYFYGIFVSLKTSVLDFGLWVNDPCAGVQCLRVLKRRARALIWFIKSKLCLLEFSFFSHLVFCCFKMASLQHLPTWKPTSGNTSGNIWKHNSVLTNELHEMGKTVHIKGCFWVSYVTNFYDRILNVFLTSWLIFCVKH